MRNSKRGILGPLAVPLALFAGSALAQTAPRAYVASGSENTLTVVDTGTNEVVETIPIGSAQEQFWGIAVRPDGSEVYVANHRASELWIVDPLTADSELQSLTRVRYVAVHPDGRFAYTLQETDLDCSDDAVLSKLEVESGQVVEQISFGGCLTGGLAVHPDGSRVWAVTDDFLFAFDSDLQSILDTGEVSDCCLNQITIHPDGSRLYTSTDEELFVLDAASLDEIASSSGLFQAEGLAVHPDGSEVYVGEAVAGRVRVFDTESNMFVANIPLGETIRGVAAHPSGKWVYAVDQGTDALHVIDTATRALVESIPVGPDPVSMGQFVQPLVGLSLHGSCPGEVDVQFWHATNRGPVALVQGVGTGTSTVPAGSCAGTELDLADPSLLRIVTMGVNGNTKLEPTLPAELCGLYLQAVDLTTCEVSNVARTPRQ